MPEKIKSKAQWRKLAGTLPEKRFRELAEGVDYASLPDRLPRTPRGGKSRKPTARKPTGRKMKPRPR